MRKLPSFRGRRPSLRATAIVGGAAALVAGSVASADTLAGSTDSANARVSQIASQNFFPTPLPTSNTSCSTSGSVGLRKVEVSWPSAGAGYSYRLRLLDQNGTAEVRPAWYQTGTSYEFAVNYNLGDWKNTHYRLVIQTVNVASGSNDSSRVYSSGSLYQSVGANGQRDAWCGGNFGRVGNESWENVSDWTPAGGVTKGKTSNWTVTSDEPAQVPSVSDTSKSSANETPEPSAGESPDPNSPGEEPSTSEAPEPSAPETSEPATTEPSKPEADEPTGDVKLALRLSGDTKQAGMVVDGESSPRCAVTIDKNAKAAISGKTMLITEPDGSVESYKAVLDPATKSCAEA